MSSPIAKDLRSTGCTLVKEDEDQVIAVTGRRRRRSRRGR
jgi:hypothetical protein